MLGNTLRAIRIANDMSMKEAGEKAGVTSTYIGEVEIGKKNPSLKVLERLADVYNIPKYKIFEFDEQYEENKYSYPQLLKVILEYYLYECKEQEDTVELVKKKI